MIASLRGILAHKSPEHLIVDIGGVGYAVRFSPTGMHRLPEVGEEVSLQIYTSVREDAIDLYGFLESREKEMFIILIGVSGIGPKLALNILSGMAPADLASAICTSDLARLNKLPGVGKKTAERLCLELKDKVQFIPAADSAIVSSSPMLPEDQQSADVISALVNLGYAPASARKAVEKVRASINDDGTGEVAFEFLLRQSLRSMV